MRRVAPAMVWMAALVLAAATARAGRYEQFTNKAAEGPEMAVLAATYFGSEGIEEFVAADSFENGGIVAFGNAWGPEFPSSPRPTVLGQGEHRGLKATSGNRKDPLPHANPDVAGMIVFYKPDLSQVVKVVRFDWGVASISAGRVSGDGKGLLVAGRATEAFRKLAEEAGLAKSLPVPEMPQDRRRRRRGPQFGPYEYEGVTCPGDVYVMRLSPLKDRIEWVWILEGHRRPPTQIWTDGRGAVYFQAHGVTRISPDGRDLKKLTEKGHDTDTAALRGVDARGNWYFGGDRNTNTGREPWRQPFLYKYSPSGEKLWTLWEYPSRALRDGKGNEEGMVSDSAARVLAFAPNGDLIVGGWSDGGNSILTRQPTDVSEPTPKSPWGMSSWGMKGANSLSYLLRIDPKTLDVTTWTLWISYLPDTYQDPKYRGSPNFASIKDILVLDDGSIAFNGGAATGAIQTPNAFVDYPAEEGPKYGGQTVSVFSKDLATLLFSSYMPGCEKVRIGPAKNGLVAVSRSAGDDGREPPTPSPTVNALQKAKKGAYDAHIVLLELP